MKDYDAYVDKLLKDIKFKLDCAKHCSHIELHIVLDAEHSGGYADVTMNTNELII